MSKGSKRRPCQIPSWLEDFRWSRAMGYTSVQDLAAGLKAHPEDRKYLTDEEMELLNEQ